MRSGDMLTRSKIKMQQSIRHVHGEGLPYFNNDQTSNPSYIYKQNRENQSQHSPKHSQSKVSENPSKYVGYRTELSQVAVLGNQPSKTNVLTRNQILKQLRQQYEILRNLNVDDSIHMNIKKYENDQPRFSEGSEYSSSKNSKKEESEVHPVRQSTKEVETLHLEKKQLEVVISNSMRKIEELLNGEITLKKTIHQLKNQLEGKGGVHQQYEKTIRGFQKNEEQLNNELQRTKHDNDKLAQKVKDMSEKIRSLQNQISNKDKEIKQGFDEQRQLHELIRVQKDRYLHLEIQCKSLKMEYDLLEKDKNNEINRLNKQLLSKEANGKSQKDNAYTIKKLEDQIKEKDKRLKELVQELVDFKQKAEPSEKKNDKSYLEELMYKSREINEYNNKALTDSVNMIFVKMAEIEKKNDETLKKEIETLKKKTEENKRNTNETDLINRIKQLQKMIDKEVNEKNRLLEDIKHLKQHKYDLEDKARRLEKKMVELQEQEQDLKLEIQELEVIKKNYIAAASAQKVTKEVQPQKEDRSYLQTLTNSFKKKQKALQDQIQTLKRRVDEAEFQTEKARKQGEFNLSLFKSEQEGEAKRIVEESARLSQKIQTIDAEIAKIKNDYENRLLLKDNEIASLKVVFEKDLSNQQIQSQQNIIALQKKYSVELKALNERLASVSSAYEKLSVRVSSFSSVETEVVELRRALKQIRSTNVGLDHLWQIKQAQYGNINDILKTLR